jgi:hypothetical protein
MSDENKTKVKLKAPEDAGGCSVDGVSYEVDKSGHVTVDAAHVADLLDHGYTKADKAK